MPRKDPHQPGASSFGKLAGLAKDIIVSVDRQTPGTEYTLEGEAQDANGNVASFMATFYGYNPEIPGCS